MEKLEQYLDAAWAVVVANYQPVLAAIIILVLGRLAAGWVRKLTRKGLERGEIDATLVPFLAKLVYWGAAGIAVGLALKDTLANFASGVMLLVFRPINVDDYVDVGGTAGTVMEIGIFATTLRSPDNIRITVPNSQVYGTTIKNYNGYETRRVDLAMGISYDDNIQTALDTIQRIVSADERGPILLFRSRSPISATRRSISSSGRGVRRPITGICASISLAASKRASRPPAAQSRTPSATFTCTKWPSEPA
jgi:small conductance mechanosensitive channel